MLHVGLDVHKHFCQVAVTDDAGDLVDTGRLRHGDKSSITDYFSQLSAPVSGSYTGIEPVQRGLCAHSALSAEGTCAACGAQGGVDAGLDEDGPVRPCCGHRAGQ